MAVSAGRQVLLDHVSEATWQAQVRRWAEREGWHIHVVYNSRRSPEGWPDLFLVRNGRAIAAELKAVGGRLRLSRAAGLCGCASAESRPMSGSPIRKPRSSAYWE